MHELSILDEVIKQVQRQSSDFAPGERVRKVTMEIGEMSAVVPSYLYSAWSAASSGSIADGAALEIISIPALARCKVCQSEYSPRGYGGTCPICGSSDTSLVSGRECNLREISLDDSLW